MKCRQRWFWYRTGLTCIRADCSPHGRPTLPLNAREGWGNPNLGTMKGWASPQPQAIRRTYGQERSTIFLSSRAAFLPRRIHAFPAPVFVTGRWPGLSVLIFLSPYGTVGAPSLRFLQGRVRCCRGDEMLYRAACLAPTRIACTLSLTPGAENLIAPALRFPPFANCAKDGAPPFWFRQQKSKAGLPANPIFGNL